MKFTSVLLGGHKDAALEVPFDPNEAFAAPAGPLQSGGKGRKGHRVRGRMNGVSFESAIVARARKFFLIVDDALRERAGVSIGDEITVALEALGSGGDDALGRVREICLALPGTEEKLAWGEPTWRVRGKLFAMFSNDHHHDGRIAIWCNVPEGMQEELVRSDAERFYVPPYVGKSGWVGVRLDRGLATKSVAAVIGEAYRHVAAKRRR